MKSLKLFSAILCFGLFYMLYVFYLRQGHVDTIYQHTEYSEIWERECKSTIVLVDNAPLSHYAQKKFWKKNSKEIIERWSPFKDKCDDVLFVNNNIGRIKRSGDIKYWIADDEICLNGKIGGCIDWDDRLFYIGLRHSISGGDSAGFLNGNTIYIRYIE